MKEKEKPPAFQFYPKDWLTDDKVLAMTNEERGIYIHLLALQWLNKGVDPAMFDKVVITPLLRRCFDLSDDGKYRNKKLEKVRAEQEEYTRKQSAAGTKGMDNRWHKPPDNNLNNDVITPLLPKHNSSSSSSSSSSTPASKESKSFCPEPEQPPALDRPKISFSFETSKFENISSEQVELWKEAFPAVDIHSEILKAAVWQAAHPEKRKKNYMAFFSRWFGKSQEKGGSTPSGPADSTGKPYPTFPPYRASRIQETLIEFEEQNKLLDSDGVGLIDYQHGKDWREKLLRGEIV